MYLPEDSDTFDFYITADGELRYHHEVGAEGHVSSSIRKNWVLMQYTGKKDKNGKEIWEGDILKVDWQDPRYKPVITQAEWDNDYAVWSFGAGATSEVKWSHEVIGNIYEQPELLSPTATQAKD